MKHFLYFSFAFFVVLLPASNVNGQNSLAQKANQLTSTMEKVHVSPIGINDTLSQRILKNTLERIDPYSLIFIQDDIAIFNSYQFSIDDQIKTFNTEFIDTVFYIFIERIKQISESLKSELSVKDILNNEFIYDSYIDFISPSTDFNSLIIQWEKWLTYKILIKTFNAYPELNLQNKDSVNLALKYAIEKEYEYQLCNIWGLPSDEKTTLDGIKKEIYLSAISFSYDPHSQYFSNDVKNTFDEMLSTSEESFGISFIDEDNLLKVGTIHPNSNIWKSNLINTDDVLVSAKDQNSNELISNCITAESLNQLINSLDISSVQLELIKANGEKVEYKAVKEKFDSESNNMLGMILRGSRNIGYLSIPSFYSSWEGQEVDGCANDVAKEILKMKEDSIEGLVLDLRNNGGGSLYEALDLAGIFIDQGPLGIIASSEGKPKLMKDMNRGTIFNGPLVVLINGGSASASEVLAGALQDHQKAIIVGNTSYGKATGQVILPIDTNAWYSTEPPEDYVKVTINKLFQLNKSSHQGIGIVPDIILPSISNTFFTRESDNNYYLTSNTIEKNIYFSLTDELPMETLSKASNERVSNSTIFQNIIALRDSILEVKDQKQTISLKIDQFYNQSKLENINYDKIFESMNEFTGYFKVKNSNFNNTLVLMNSSLNVSNQKMISRLEKDLHLNEAYQIILDYINIK